MTVAILILIGFWPPRQEGDTETEVVQTAQQGGFQVKKKKKCRKSFAALGAFGGFGGPLGLTLSRVKI